MDMLIRNGRVFDLEGDTAQPPLSDILIEGGVIREIAPHIAARAGVVEYDAQGLLLIPGLVNAHYHSHDVMLRGLFEQMPLDIWGLYSGPGNYPAMTREDVALRTLLGAADCLSNGITTLQDMVSLTGDQPAQLEGVLEGYEASGIRVSLGLQVADKIAAETVPYWDEFEGELDAFLRSPVDTLPLEALIRASIDQPLSPALAARLSWALAPSAPQRASDRLLSLMAELSQSHGLQVFTHVYEARNQAVMARLKSVEGSLIARLARFGLVGPQLTIAHGVWIADEELAALGAGGANFVSNPVSNLKLLNGFAPVRGYSDHGVSIALGCDNCSGNDVQSLFQSMKSFALYWGMQSLAGQTGAAKAAFHAATLGGARALGLEGQIGALRVGYRGDVVMLDLATSPYRPLHNALNQMVYGETGQSIRAVVVEGALVVENGALCGHPAAQLQDAAEALRQRMTPAIAATAARNEALVPPLYEAWHKANDYPLPFNRYAMVPPSPKPSCGCGGSHD